MPKDGLGISRVKKGSLTGLERHDLELAGSHQFVVDVAIDGQAVEGRRVLGASRDCTARESNVVGRSQNENSLDLKNIKVIFESCAFWEKHNRLDITYSGTKMILFYIPSSDG